jgi:hypothetical protein
MANIIDLADRLTGGPSFGAENNRPKNIEDLKTTRVHALCLNNEGLLDISTAGVCMHCGTQVTTESIKDWVDNGSERTAICPCCSADAILPVVTPEMLRKISDEWFNGSAPAADNADMDPVEDSLYNEIYPLIDRLEVKHNVKLTIAILVNMARKLCSEGVSLAEIQAITAKHYHHQEKFNEQN